MRLYAVCVVKNEADVIGESLVHALQYCDKIIVVDNASTDRTWDIVLQIASQHERVIPHRRTDAPFVDGLRALGYNDFNEELSADDWWLRLDADEFLAEDPRPLIRLANAHRADIIESWQINFYFTDKDLSDLSAGTVSNDTPVVERRRWYEINWQEPRLFRNQPGRKWNIGVSDYLPDGLGKVLRKRILNRHYMFRSPEQIQNRLRVRFGQLPFQGHVRTLNWKNEVRDSRDFQHCEPDGPWKFTMSALIRFYGMKLGLWPHRDFKNHEDTLSRNP